MAVRIQPVRALNGAGQQRAFGSIEAAEVFAEECLRSLAKPVDREAAALTEIDLIGIHLEDLLLAKPRFELERNHDLAELAGEFFLRTKEEPAGELHRQRRSTAFLLVREDILHAALDHTEIVDATMLEEPAVFNRDDRLHHARGNLVVLYEAALGAVLVFGERGDELRLQLVAL